MKRTSVSFLLLTSAFAPVFALADDEIDFNRDIRPILSDNCFQCHGPDATHREADLRLDQEDVAKADRGGYQVIAPGELEASELIARITADDAEERMPPPDSGEKLTADEIELLRRWIEQGASWARHWAYVPPRRHPAPEVKDQAWPRNWIDRFLLARIENEGLAPSPDADPVTLVRRLCFDLTGLPPSPEEVDRFVQSTDSDAYQQLVDRLLASDRFGERMAVYWLDLVRYADTVGYHGDQDHSISPYRDWVIDAFNDNLPFDEFTRAQLAGDLLEESDIDDKIASGYNRLLQTSHEGGVQPKEYLAIYGADRVRNISAVWMGATMGCCQCHDHKYDPYTTRDFYSLQAFFADLDEARHFRNGTDSVPTKREPEIKVLTKRERRRVAKLEQQIADLKSRSAKLDADQESQRQGLLQQLDTLAAERDAIQKSARLTMISVAIESRTIRVLPRGNWLDDSGPVVEPAIPEFLGTLDASQRRRTRLDLANWLSDTQHGVGGLTARVMVNRFWYLLFGAGLAEVLDDFGGQGAAPVHPELLDTLAVEFVESGWDVKHMIKLLVMSRAYRQSSIVPPALMKRDPGNRLYARQSRFRLPAEMVRDNALALSGLLVLDYGGSSVKPYQPADYYRHLNFPARKYKHDTDSRQWRRGVYVHWQRQFLHPMLAAFDAPSREECTAARPRSNTPVAAMVLLNDPTFVEAARVFAERIVREGGDTNDARLRMAFRQATSREPSHEELALLSELLSINQKQYASDTAAAEKLISTGLAPLADDLDVAELASWTAVARALLCMNETITRN